MKKLILKGNLLHVQSNDLIININNNIKLIDLFILKFNIKYKYNYLEKRINNKILSYYQFRRVVFSLKMQKCLNKIVLNSLKFL